MTPRRLGIAHIAQTRSIRLITPQLSHIPLEQPLIPSSIPAVQAMCGSLAQLLLLGFYRKR